MYTMSKSGVKLINLIDLMLNKQFISYIVARTG